MTEEKADLMNRLFEIEERLDEIYGNFIQITQMLVDVMEEFTKLTT